MKINRLIIKKLFGTFNYDINLNTDQKSNMTIITGPNGYGKTTILRILNSLNTSNLYTLYSLKFEKVDIEFDDDTHLAITKSIQNETEEDSESSDVTFAQNSQSKELNFKWYNSEDSKPFTSFVINDANVSKAYRRTRYEDDMFPRSFRRSSSKELKEYLQSSEMFINRLAQEQQRDAFLMQLQTISVKYISANRIYNDKQVDEKDLPIERIEKSLKDKLETVRVDFLKLSERENKLFIEEILGDSQKDITEETYKSITFSLRAQSEKLKRYKLTNEFEIPEYSESKKNILSAYIFHLEKKIKWCEDFLGKMELFDEMLRSKKFANKTITFSPDYGLRVVANNGEFIDVALLSSGEQHEIVMLYNLIFEVGDSSILLVDEPENSLHVAWQRMVVPDLERLAEVKKLQLIIATHSPSIVSEKPDAATDLFYINEEDVD